MKLRKFFKWGLPLIVLALLGAASILYLFAAGVPEHYQPASLPPEQREQAATQFLRRIQDFGNLTQRNVPFDWTLTQDELNDALASLDEIAGRTLEEGKTAEIYRMMEKVGIDQPAIALRDGVLTLMIRSREFNKVVSADLAFSFTPDKQMQVHLKGARVGYLPMPESMVRKWMGKLQAGVSRKVDAANRSASSPTLLGEMKYDDLAGIMSQVISAIDSKPLPTERTWPVNKKAFRIDGLKITPGKLTLHVQPVGRK